MRYARIENGTAVEVFTPPEGATIGECFHPDLVTKFSVCPDNVTAGSTVDGSGGWTIAAALPPPSVPPQLPLLSPMAFYLAFTPVERIAIKTSADPMVKEFWETYELAVQSNASIDPNLVSVQDSLAYLAQPTDADPPGAGILASIDRVAQILAGTPQ